MRPRFRTELVNGVFDDPALYVDFLFERRALLFDLGELAALPPRKMLRLSHVFVSHTHMDHFAGFDRMLRLLLGRERVVHLFGPAGFIGQVAAKLAAYTWNLVGSFSTDLVFVVTEVGDESYGRVASFRLKEGFQRRDDGVVRFTDRRLVDEPAFVVRFAVLDHGIPCLAFALEEPCHVNVWRNRLDELELPVGPWLNALKAAVQRDAPEDTPIRICWRDAEGDHDERRPLGILRRQVLSVEPGQRIAYVTDAAPHQANAEAILDLARDADLFYAETPFLAADAAEASRKKHLTAAFVGELARRAGVRRLVPFHLSTRYSDRPQAVLDEAQAAFGASP